MLIYKDGACDSMVCGQDAHPNRPQAGGCKTKFQFTAQPLEALRDPFPDELREKGAEVLATTRNEVNPVELLYTFFDSKAVAMHPAVVHDFSDGFPQRPCAVFHKSMQNHSSRPIPCWGTKPVPFQGLHSINLWPSKRRAGVDTQP